MKRIFTVTAMAVLMLVPALAQAKRVNRTLIFGQDTLIEGKDDISIHAQCIQNDGGSGDDRIRVYAVTQDDAILRGTDNYLGSSFLTSVTPPADSEIMTFYATSGQEAFTHRIDLGFVMNLTTGRGFTFTAETSLLGLNSNGIDCMLSIDLDKIKKFKAAK